MLREETPGVYPFGQNVFLIKLSITYLFCKHFFITHMRLNQNIFGEHVSIGLNILHVRGIIETLKIDEFVIMETQNTQLCGSKMRLSIPRIYLYVFFSIFWVPKVHFRCPSGL